MKKLLFILILLIGTSCTNYTCPTYASKPKVEVLRPVTNKIDLLVSFGVIILVVVLGTQNKLSWNPINYLIMC